MAEGRIGNEGQRDTNAAPNTENGGESSEVSALNVGNEGQSNRDGAATYDPAEELRVLCKPMGVNKPIEASSTFTVKEAEDMRLMFEGVLKPENNFFIYSRHLNPTVMNLSTQIAKIENTEDAYCTSSGMAAISSVLLHLCKTGDHVVASNCLYGGTFALLKHFLPEKCNITTTFVDVKNTENVKNAIREKTTKVIFVESISNPTLTVADIPKLAAIAREKHVKLVVDNTFAPMVLTPAKHGADVVVHSVTKFISGGSDIIAGVVCGSKDLVKSMINLLNGALMLLGPTMNPKVAFEISQRLPHLGIRMKEHGRRALEIAKRLNDIEKYRNKVIYPGLESHPQHELLESIANKDYGFGGVLCVDMGSENMANYLMQSLQNTSHFGLMAVSLGYFETLMSCSGSSTSSEMDDDDRKNAGISPGLVRISIGFTGSLEQRWEEFREVLP